MNKEGGQNIVWMSVGYLKFGVVQKSKREVESGGHRLPPLSLQDTVW